MAKDEPIISYLLSSITTIIVNIPFHSYYHYRDSHDRDCDIFLLLTMMTILKHDQPKYEYILMAIHQSMTILYTVGYSISSFQSLQAGLQSFICHS